MTHFGHGCCGRTAELRGRRNKFGVHELCDAASRLAWKRAENEPGDRTIKKGGALFRDVESINERFESGIILAFHGQNQSDIVASLQQDEHFAQVIISASRNFTICESSA